MCSSDCWLRLTVYESGNLCLVDIFSWVCREKGFTSASLETRVSLVSIWVIRFGRLAELYVPLLCQGLNAVNVLV